ncbi:MAG: exodeoxyribonuclease VII large subunit, partial [Candidatus Uhrbacteria bacterium]
MPENVLSVSQYLQIVNAVLREHVPSQEIVVEGELGGYTVKDGKWIIFDLKDEKDAKTKVACFGTTFKIVGAFESGMRVRVFGYPTVKGWSTFQIDVQRMEPVGEGALKKAYDALKKKLEGEGLFDLGRKRSLPRFPQRIGLITSRDAAAYGDFLRILNNRWGGVEVVFAHVRVQGNDAVPSILSALSDLSNLSDPLDLIVLTRGGGSLEDLHAFNDESVARAVYSSKIPVVVGVGHERDESLCDFVADVRASTPSNAAERIVPNRTDVEYELAMMTRRMEERLTETIARRQLSVDRATRTVGLVLDRERQRFLSRADRLTVAFGTWKTTLRERLSTYERVLKQVDPKRVLARGYSIVTVNGKVVSDASTLEV